MPVSQSWLEQVKERTLEPELTICDPHHHFWDYPKSRYLVNEFMADVGSGHNIVSTVSVECLSMYDSESTLDLAPVGETQFVDSLAAQSLLDNTGDIRIAAGIISHADLRRTEMLDQVLQAHTQASPGRFRGIRHSASWDASESVRNSHSKPPPALYLDNKFRQGFARLEKYNLVFDAWLYHPQLGDLSDLANAFPYQSIVLDHVGGPLGIGPYANKHQEVFVQWQKSITALSKHDNVVVKLGGLGMPINGFNWHKKSAPPSSKQLAEVNRPYIAHCIDTFGVDRCMFESNLPVDKVSASYHLLWNSFKRITKDFSSIEKAKLYHDNATRIYRL
jgi:L-fuconolactonase